MQPTEQAKTEIKARAKEFDTGPVPLSMENVILGLPSKPGPSVDNLGSVLANSWNLTEYIGQRKFVKCVDITPSSTTIEPLWQYHHTFSQVVVDHFRKFVGTFALRSWKLNFHFEFRSNFQQVGMLMVVYHNMPSNFRKYMYPDRVFNQFVVQSQLPHKFIMMGEDQDLVVGLNWLSPFKASTAGEVFSHPSGDEHNDYEMGEISLWAPFAMQVASGVTANKMTVRIWSYLTDITLAGYTPSNDDP
ncbi:MAG: putative capsid protein [Macrobrachium rosenbergii virus 2]|nr:MAG: putative capsid protein [Macrobrachium rosenbergii virus 2]